MSDIDTMAAGPELDALVAEKVMGWNVHFRDPELRGGREHFRDGEHSTIYLPEQWTPSTDIAAAWEVVNKIKARGPQSSILLEFLRGASDLAQADNAPLAICRAALKAVGA